MKEDLFFLALQGGDRRIFVHVHRPDEPNGQALLFLNPILDEAKRVHTFQSQIARLICARGSYVFRFDYYGTGDSGGELYELDLDVTMTDISQILQLLEGKYHQTDLGLLGIRFGADLAIKIASKMTMVSSLHLIAPIINGSRYLVEQNFRQKAFYKINKMKDMSGTILIGNALFQDYQGFPMSGAVLSFLSGINISGIDIKGKQIHLYTIPDSIPGNLLHKFIAAISHANTLIYKEVKCEKFWANPEIVDTSRLIGSIMNALNFGS